MTAAFLFEFDQRMASTMVALVMVLFLLATASCDTWPTGEYCILKGATPCPAGFTTSSVILSVNRDFGQQNDRNGKPLTRLGNFGASSLISDDYDNRYTLTLTTCCR